MQRGSVLFPFMLPIGECESPELKRHQSLLPAPNPCSFAASGAHPEEAFPPRSDASPHFAGAELGGLLTATRGTCASQHLHACSPPALIPSQINYKKPGRNYNCKRVELHPDELQFVSFFSPNIPPNTLAHTNPRSSQHRPPRGEAHQPSCNVRKPNPICEREDQRL